MAFFAIEARGSFMASEFEDEMLPARVHCAPPDFLSGMMSEQVLVECSLPATLVDDKDKKGTKQWCKGSTSPLLKQENNYHYRQH
jgi:hypothetical protein